MCTKFFEKFNKALTVIIIKARYKKWVDSNSRKAIF